MHGYGTRVAVVAAMAALMVPLSVGRASADPAVPQARDLVGVGAQTTQALLNRFAADYNASLGSDTTSPRLYSWDATGTSPIITKGGATPIVRPDGAVAGIKALAATTGETVDFARSDRGPKAKDPYGLDFVVFAKDAVTWSATRTGNAPAQLTPAQLNAIYSCTTVTWNQISSSLPATAIKPVLPQADSGTRSFFLSAIGNPTLGGCVTTGPEENEGTDPSLGDPNVVFPYSVGHYLGQTVGNHGTATDAPGNLTLRNVVIGSSTLTPVTNNQIDPNFANTLFGRMLYNVFRDAEWTATDAHGTAIQNVFGPSGWICNDPTAAADLASYGFLAAPAVACGSATLS
ncbi:substrate-binding domain-containing protein [Kitasatospora sp. NPDC089797]|uniref:PstS family phosphate ABC transporter substrate-binding protein n=1 Tax=Kitasatospora sp. NPDC089797 TaxID=3155298 RepID=UPI00344839E7